MELIRWNPMYDRFNLRHRMDEMLGDYFYPSIQGQEDSGVSNLNPAADIYENDDNIVIKAELPGIDKKDISVDVKNRVLTLKGERSSDDETTEDNYYRRERRYGRFERAFTLSAEVDPDKIKADYKDGVLKIEIPKPVKPKRKKATRPKEIQPKNEVPKTSNLEKERVESKE